MCMDLLREGPSFTPDRAQGFEGQGCPVDPTDHVSRGQCSVYLKNRATECPGLSPRQSAGFMSGWGQGAGRGVHSSHESGGVFQGCDLPRGAALTS